MVSQHAHMLQTRTFPGLPVKQFIATISVNTCVMHEAHTWPLTSSVNLNYYWDKTGIWFRHHIIEHNLCHSKTLVVPALVSLVCEQGSKLHCVTSGLGDGPVLLMLHCFPRVLVLVAPPDTSLQQDQQVTVKVRLAPAGTHLF